VKLLAHRAGLPGNVHMITGSAFLPAPAYRQEGGASSRLARKGVAERLLMALLFAANTHGRNRGWAPASCEPLEIINPKA
jgi:hypothetical protein